MNALDEVIMACREYKRNTNDEPRFIVVPVERARAIVQILIDKQGKSCPVQIQELAVMFNDDEFAAAASKLTLYGAQLMVLTEQIVLGGWAENGC